MAGITNAGTQVLINSNKVPTGYTLPSVTTFSDKEKVYENYPFTIAKSTVEAATEVATFTALVAAITTAVTNLITTKEHVDTLNVDVYANLKDVASNQANGDELYKNGVVDYDCIVDIFVKSAA